MTSAFNPVDGPPRLIRFVPALPGEMLAEFIEKHNLLIIDREKFSLLRDWEQERVIRSRSTIERSNPYVRASTVSH